MVLQAWHLIKRSGIMITMKAIIIAVTVTMMIVMMMEMAEAGSVVPVGEGILMFVL